MRLFAAKTTKQRAKRELPRPQPATSCDSREARAQEPQSSWPYPCPAVAVRRQQKSRRRTTRRDIFEHYDFSTALLDIEVDHRPEADPFLDRTESMTPQATSADGPSCSDHAHPEPPMPTSRDIPAADAGSPPASRNASPASSAPYYEPFLNPSQEGIAFRALMVSHTTSLFARQHRTSAFQLVIVDRWARFVRWDRSGAVGTERFDYVSEPQPLAEFFWRFAHMTDEERGFDSSAILATKSEAALFTTAVRGFLNDMKTGTKGGKPVRRLPNAECTLDDTGTYPTWKIHIVDAETQKSTALIVKRPFSGHFKIFGRSTRAYVAFDLTERRLVFLKDNWRQYRGMLRAESRTYRELREHGVRHVPEMLYGGDVLDEKGNPQQTATQVHTKRKSPWRITSGRYDSLVHHRIVQEIAYPLKTATGAREYVQAIQDAQLGNATALFLEYSRLIISVNSCRRCLSKGRPSTSGHQHSQCHDII